LELTAELFRDALVVLHFLGLASLLGGFITQMKAMAAGTAKIVPAMVHGAWTMLITGIALVGVAEWRGAMGAAIEVDHMKVGVKTLVLAGILFLVLYFKKKDSVKAPVFGVIGLLTILNVVLAVFW
jgi:predicted metal-dependent hydrolase